MDFPDQLPGLKGQFHFLLYPFFMLIDKDTKASVLGFQIFQLNHVIGGRPGIRLVAVRCRLTGIIDADLGEVRDDNVPRFFLKGHLGNVVSRLFVGSDHLPLPWFLRIKVDSKSFLLDQDFRCREICIRIPLRERIFERDVLRGCFDSKECDEKLRPVQLTILFFLPPPGPVLYEFFCCLPFFLFCHSNVLLFVVTEALICPVWPFEQIPYR